MKVLLIQPPSCDPMTDRIFLFEPLALEYLGAGLKQHGHEVRLLDARLERVVGLVARPADLELSVAQAALRGARP